MPSGTNGRDAGLSTELGVGKHYQAVGHALGFAGQAAPAVATRPSIVPYDRHGAQGLRGPAVFNVISR